MRQLLFVAFLFVALFAASAIVGDAQTKQIYFTTGEACTAALANGTAEFYKPHANNLFKPINPLTEVLTELEQDECEEMIVDRSRNFSDYYWVAQPMGTKMVKELNGLSLKRRYSCGNPVRDRHQIPIKPAPPIIPAPTPAPVATPTPAPKRKCDSGWLYNEDSDTCVQPPAPVVCPTCPQISYKANKEGIWNTKQEGLSAIVGGVGTGVASDGNLKQRAIKGGIGGLISAGVTLGSRIPKSNRSDKSFTFTVTFTGQTPLVFTLERGESYNRNGFQMKWNDDHWEVVSENCFGSFAPRDTFIFTPVILAIRTKNSGSEAIKNEPITPIGGGGIAAGNGGQFPGNGVPPNPSIIIPRRPGQLFVDSNGTTQLNNAGQTTTQATPSAPKTLELTTKDGQKVTTKVM